ncbi:MAG: histidine kinase [candidate division KSB1 bacterium]
MMKHTHLTWVLLLALWALAAPVLWRLARRFPLESKHWLQHLVLHFICALALGMSLRAAASLVAMQLLAFDEPSAHSRLLPELLRFVIFDMAFYFALLAAAHAQEYFQKFHRERLRATQLQAHLVQAEVHALQAQLHPHFLFNTYHALVGLLLRQENAKAIAMLERLSALLRLTLARAVEPETTLQNELELVDHYLGIQQIRFSDRLRVQKDISPEALAAYVPTLILQPLVENSIRHGIALSARAGLIAIHARREHGLLRLQIRDDGPGLTTNGNGRLHEGVGLTNTRSRLRHLYGATQRLELRNDEHGGLCVTLVLPFHERRGDYE